MILSCLVCDAAEEFAPFLYGCPLCADEGRRGAMVCRYPDTRRVDLRDDSKPGLWRYRGLLPPVEPVSLHEGNTPLIRIGNLYLKNETANPTWSWKDRPGTVSISVARHFGFKETVAISTGNHGNSVSAYSAAAGLGCTIYCNPEAPDLQLALMSRYGSRVFRTANANPLVHDMVKCGGVFPASIVCPMGGFANPYGIEGFKTIAFEIVDQLGRAPDRVFVPAGSGDGLYGIYKGFKELAELGVTEHVPKIIGCQATGAACYAKAIEQNAPRPIHIDNPRTIALSIAEEIGGYPALWAIRDTGGTAIAIGDEAIDQAARECTRAGYAIEPASATSVAVAMSLPPAPNETWVAIATGALVKWPPLITRGFTMPDLLPPLTPTST
ncbi:MAG: pyridoxal-phosphate dependent enzyme [Bryobacterales bacterium]|nr:pyridoxal-phosphate dependent enzyme [Bryobacterales bacterium]